ncbi:hypothetical protein J3R30DRAFT_3503906, partial [Lentinula aciculospora]
ICYIYASQVFTKLRDPFRYLDITYILLLLCNYFAKDFRHEAIILYLLSFLSDLHYSFYIPSFVLYL